MKTKKIKATYRNGVIEPFDKINLPEGQELEVEFRVLPKTPHELTREEKEATQTYTASEQKQAPATRKNPAAQRLIKAMEKPPHLTDEDLEALNQSIKEGKIPIKFDSPFEPDEPKNNE